MVKMLASQKRTNEGKHGLREGVRNIGWAK